MYLSEAELVGSRKWAFETPYFDLAKAKCGFVRICILVVFAQHTNCFVESDNSTKLPDVNIAGTLSHPVKS